MNVHMESLAAQVREERKRRKWTQADVAQAAGVSLGMVSNFERNKHIPQGANLRAILAALEIVPENGDQVAEETRSEWPSDIRVFLDAIGAYLNTMDEPTRLRVIHDLTRRIIGGML